jgi:hypothetical protein
MTIRNEIIHAAVSIFRRCIDRTEKYATNGERIITNDEAIAITKSARSSNSRRDEKSTSNPRGKNIRVKPSRWILILYALNKTWDIPEAFLMPTGRKVSRETLYSGDSMIVKVDPATGEGTF